MLSLWPGFGLCCCLSARLSCQKIRWQMSSHFSVTSCWAHANCVLGVMLEIHQRRWNIPKTITVHYILWGNVRFPPDITFVPQLWELGCKSKSGVFKESRNAVYSPLATASNFSRRVLMDVLCAEQAASENNNAPIAMKQIIWGGGICALWRRRDNRPEVRSGIRCCGAKCAKGFLGSYGDKHF